MTVRHNSTHPLRVAIQGISGCFHDAAAREYFGAFGLDVEPIEFESFPQLFEAMHCDASLLGIVAIENTIAGSLLANHELLRLSDARIVGEYKKRISHSLCVVPGTTLGDIEEVNSHPMALMQCDQWFHRHPTIKKVEKFDTAGAAREISQRNLKNHAAICPSLAADIYGLEILEEGIETNKRNFTRFLILADPVMAEELGFTTEKSDKASIMITLPHKQGALAKVLSIFSFYDLNLEKIQSTPIVGREWEYRFYIDLTFESELAWQQALQAVRPLINDLKILGEYSSEKTSEKTDL